MAVTIDPYITQQLQSRRRTATTQYGLARARLEAEKSHAGLVQAQALRDIGQQYQQNRQKLPGGFAQRGLLNSGIYGRALTSLRTGHADALARNQLQYQGQLNQFGLQGRESELTYQDELLNLASEEQALRTKAILSQLFGV